MTPTLTDETNPLAELDRWYEEARKIGEPKPEAMTLATATPAGRPSARIVLYKSQSGRGIDFYTNYESRKGQELENNPFAALVFYWPLLGRQIRVEGGVQRLDENKSDYYFATRARDSQIAAWCSAQSETVASREALEAAHAATAKRFAEGKIPRPPNWGGFELVAERVEFWIDRDWRLHDRFLYEYVRDVEPGANDGLGAWRMSRLFP